MATDSSSTALKKLLIIGGSILLVLVFISSALMLFVTARLQQNLAKDPNYSAPELYTKAVEQTEKGEYEVAEKYLEEALRKGDESTYRNQLAVVKYRLKKYQEAITLYEKLIAEGKDAAFAWNGIGNVYRDWAEADPGQAATLLPKAETAYRNAIALNSGYIAAYSNLALLYHNTDRTNDALKVLDEGIQATGSKELEQVKKTISGR